MFERTVVSLSLAGLIAVAASPSTGYHGIRDTHQQLDQLGQKLAAAGFSPAM
jgi:hypothetical protein